VTATADAALARAAAGIVARAGGPVEVGIVLGSGLAAALRDRGALRPVPYADLGALPPPTAAGHAAEALVGTLSGRRVVAFCGRYHLYEGRGAHEVVAPVRLAIAAGARTLVLTNAAGGLDRTYRAGDVMVVRDHLNLTGTNPLACADGLDGVPERFVDMSAAYDPPLRALARAAARRHGLRAHEGVYAGLLGPSFETPAEVAHLRLIGADAVGMSTVLETIAARARGARVVALSLITNVHDGTPTSSGEVLVAAARASGAIAGTIETLVAGIEPQPEESNACST
jgi:purine-nucleoside phosphorylase